MDAWLKLSGEPGIQKLIKNDAYSKAYVSLLKHFRGLTRIDWDAALVGLHIVYGWMPTIPDLNLAFESKIDKQRIISILEKIREGGVPDANEVKEVSGFTNNSVIGVSKLLHFLNPEKCPIWDQRVARIFLWPGISFDSVNQAKRWIEYQKTLSEWLMDSQVISSCQKLRELADFLNVSPDMRLIELVMFHAADPTSRVSER